ncbi:NLI interacting factor-like phosphatase [Archangium gephyra]|uniref:NLI interacting factor-like phosphatase n=1 Tax=Archangium gephyra TaxID=48 RepID=A0ABX9JVT2_9BACT|nr:NIF family HAD-type phosphatase [Archangium gephyra]REG27975.1 NLI interacting factor-like phosphatase [Archangium gephyra]
MSRFSLLLLLTTPLLGPFLGCAAGSSAQRTEAPPAATATSMTGTTSRAELEAVTIPALPDWVDKYAGPNEEERRFFNISGLMERFQLARVQAVELQNHYRDLIRSQPPPTPEEAFTTALARVRRGELESRLQPEALGKARFIVVFDLDETLISQYYPAQVGEACHELAIPRKDGVRYVKLVPGWQQAFERIQALGGAIVLFSANVDAPTLELLAHWKLGGVPLTEHPAIAGILTNSYLVLQEKSEGVSDPKKGNPVREPSKDLRVFDETLSRVIIVDDNPTRLFQMRNARIFKKFEAEPFCTTSDPALRRAFEQALPTVVQELEDSVRDMDARGVPFAEAYLPYTSLGQVTVQFLVDSGGFDRARAIEYVRRHPKVVDPRY